MRFKVGDLTFSASVADVSQRASAQTGAQLRTLTIQFRAPKQELHEQLLVETQQRTRGGVFSLTDAGEPEAEWRVDDSGFTYVGSEPWGMHHHTWRIEQIERLAITALILGSLRLQPYDYREELANDGQLRLAARAAASEADLATLSTLTACEVVREGISAEPRRMVLEGYVWGQGAHGQAVALVCADVGEPRVTLAGATGAGADELVELLVDNGLLDLTRLQARRHAARRVADIDGWAL
jgi:hypothetical protein